MDYYKVDAEPKYIQVVSEAYVVITKLGYAPVVDVIERRTSTTKALFISASSLSVQLEALREENGGKFNGLEFWIRKASYEKTARYVIEQD